MRKLTKTCRPLVLDENQAAWTALYQAAPSNQKTSPWKKAEIVGALAIETFHKCAYCESRMGSVSYAHVEHIKPKSSFPELVVDWDNLTLACQICNGNKRDYYDANQPLLNPYTDDPLQHLSIVGPLVEGKPGSTVGRRTVDKLKLRRTDLLLERAARIEALHRLLERWSEADGQDCETFSSIIADELGLDREFTQTLRCYAAAHGYIVETDSL